MTNSDTALSAVFITTESRNRCVRRASCSERVRSVISLCRTEHGISLPTLVACPTSALVGTMCTRAVGQDDAEVEAERSAALDRQPRCR